MNVYHEEEYKGYNIKIVHDFEPLNPRKDYDNLCTIASFGDREGKWLADYEESFEEYEEENKKKERSQERLYLPIWFYNYGSNGSKIGFNNSRTDEPEGWIYVTKETARKEYNVKIISKKLRERIFEIMRGEIETYNQYLQGEVYGFMTETSEDENGEREEIDSCWGFFGEPERSGLMDEARSSIDYAIEKAEEAKREDELSWSYMAL